MHLVEGCRVYIGSAGIDIQFRPAMHGHQNVQRFVTLSSYWVQSGYRFMRPVLRAGGALS